MAKSDIRSGSKAVAVLTAFLAALTLGSSSLAEVKGPDPKFELLTIGTVTFTNATVTQTAETYIFVTHEGGLTSIKVADLPVEVREQLGYEVPKPKTNSVANWTRSQVTKIRAQDLDKVKENFGTRLPQLQLSGRKLTPGIIMGVISLVLFCHIFASFCFLLICRKTGLEPGALIWIPVAQLVPVVRAANMSAWWALAWLVPVLNVVAQVLWAFNIAKARQKSPWTAVLLLLPPTSLPAFLYLAFSAGAVPEKPQAGAQIMTLEAI